MPRGRPNFSATTSKIYSLPLTEPGQNRDRALIYAAPTEEGDKERYGFRWLVRDAGGYLMSDEVGERILMLTENGNAAGECRDFSVFG